MIKELSERQKRFADYYIETGDEQQAAMRAGYQKPYAGQLLNSKRIQKYLSTRLEKLEDKRIADAKEVLMYLTSVMRGDIPEEDGQDLSVKKAVSVKDQMKAAELLGRRYGIFLGKSSEDTPDLIAIRGDDELEE